MLAQEALTIEGDLGADPCAQLWILAHHGLRETVADVGALDEHRRASGPAQAKEQIGVLIPEGECGIEELPGSVSNSSIASRPIAKHQAAKSKRIGPPT